MQISKNQLKYIAALSQKKFRDEEKRFVAEGTKLISDLSVAFRCTILVATSAWYAEHKTISARETVTATADDLKKISGQKSPQGVLAVFEKPEYRFDAKDLSSRLSLALDDVQDPGNLGTIIRIADWFGIHDIFCSEHCADAFGPKTVQATMGALSRVRVHYVNLVEFLTGVSNGLPVYGTFMDGRDIYRENLSANGIIVMGNEGNGISPKTESLITRRLLAPNFPENEPTSESLNVGVATAVVCAEFRRRVR